MDKTTLTATCCIAGGGPAGIMLGFLLARAGIEVIVLEKHKDFFRDFRGDTIHPSTFHIMEQLGLLDEFLKVPHQEITQLTAVINGNEVMIGDFTHLPIAKSAVGLMPQWDFLNFIADKAKSYKTFRLILNATAKELVKENGKVTGIKAETPEGIIEIQAQLVVGADGRSSVVKQLAGLKTIVTGVPIDVLWFRLSRAQTDPGQVLGRFDHGKLMVMLDRGDYWQCAYVIVKDGYKTIRENGLEAFRKEITHISPFLGDRPNEIKDWDQVKLLSVEIDHLEKWCADGILCIGDAAHAMSPVGGVGINLALQDAVATANILYKPLSEKKEMNVQVLRGVQKRREFPARVIQMLQVKIQNVIIHSRENKKNMENNRLPFVFKLIKWFPVLRRIPARVIGMGIRPENVQTQDVQKIRAA